MKLGEAAAVTPVQQAQVRHLSPSRPSFASAASARNWADVEGALPGTHARAYRGTISPRPRPVSAEQGWLRLAKNLAEVKERAKERICREIDILTLDELY